MEKEGPKEIIKMVLFAVALAMGVATVALSFTGTPGSYDAEPLLGIAVFALALAGLNSLDDSKF